jgi:hypothetical protein
MMKNLGDLNDKLLNLSKQRKELTKGLPQPKGQPVVQSGPTEQRIEVKGDAVFVGSTADLNKRIEAMMQKQREEQQEKVIDVIPTTSVQNQEQPHGSSTGGVQEQSET